MKFDPRVLLLKYDLQITEKINLRRKRSLYRSSANLNKDKIQHEPPPGKTNNVVSDQV